MAIFEFTAIQGSVLSANPLAVGSAFAMPIAATFTITISDGDALLGGDLFRNELGDDADQVMLDDGTGAANIRVYAERRLVVRDASGEEFTLIEIETAGNGDTQAERFYAFVGTPPTQNAALSVIEATNAIGDVAPLAELNGGLSFEPNAAGEIVLEAEDLALNGFVAAADGQASGGEIVELTQPNGSFSVIFGGAEQDYNILLDLVDAPGGASEVALFVNGQIVTSAVLDFADPEGGTERLTIAAPNIFLSVGDEIEVRGVADGPDLAGVDRLVFISNAPPDAVADNATVAEGNDVTVNVLINDSDPDGDPIFLADVAGLVPNDSGDVFSDGGRAGRISGALNGEVTFETLGRFDDLAQGESDFVTVDYTVADDAGGTSVSTLTIEIVGVNNAPIADDFTGQTDEDQAFNGQLVGFDVDGPILEFSLDAAPANGTVSVGLDGSFTYTPDANFSGDDTFSFVVTDGIATDIGVATITVTPVNDAPVIDEANSDTSFVFDEDEFQSQPGNINQSTAPGGFGPGFSGPVHLDALRADPAWLLANGFGGPNAAIAPGLADFPVSGFISFADIDVGDTHIAEVVNVNVVDLAGALTGIDFGSLFAINQVDAANGIVDYTFTADVATIVAANGLGAGEVAEVSFTVRISDDAAPALFDETVVTITIQGENDAPDAVQGAFNAVEDTVFNGQLDAVDDDGDALTFALAGAPVFGSVVIAADGSFTYTPAPDFDGGDTFTYTVSDGIATVTQSAVVTVGAVNDAPVALNDAFATSEDDIRSDDVLGSIGGGPDFDVDGDALSVVAVNGQAAAIGTTITLASGALLTLRADGTFDYDPNGAFESLGGSDTATDTFSYTVSDGIATSDAQVQMTINGVNDAPVVTNDAFAVDEGKTFNGNLLANDVDPEGFALSIVDGGGDVNLSTTVSVFSDGGREAFVDVNADGTIALEAFGFDDLGDGETDTLTFDYVVSDVEGLQTAGQAVFTINGENDAPLIDPQSLDQAVSLLEDDSVNGVQGDGFVRVTASIDFIDIDLNDVHTLSVIAANELAGSGPIAGFDFANALTVDSVISGVATFTFAIDDNLLQTLGGGDANTFEYILQLADNATIPETATTSFTVDLIGVNDNPVANDLVVSGAEDTPINDVLTANDIDGDVLTFSLDFAPQFGAISVNSDGSFTYVPDQNFSGTDSFQFNVTDGQGGFDAGAVTITVVAQNDAPIASDDTAATDQNTPAGANLLAGPGADFDAEFDTLSVTEINGIAITDGEVVTLASGALLTIGTDGEYSYDPNGQFNDLAGGGTPETATDVITYTVSDGQLTDEGTLTVTISGLNDAPVAVDDNFAVAENAAPAGFNVIDNDADIDGDTLTIADGQGDVNLSTTVSITSTGGRTAFFDANSNGLLTITVGNNFDDLAQGETDTVDFTYFVTDAGGLQSSAVATFTINGVNDAPVAADDLLFTDEDTALTGDLFADNSFGVDADVDGSFTVSAVDGIAGDVGQAVTLASGATLTVNSDGTFDYDPNGAFDGLSNGQTDTDTFTYTIDDGLATSTATATVTIDGVNDDPIAVDDAFTVNEDVAGTNDNLLLNDIDPEGQTLLLVDGGGDVTLSDTFIITSAGGRDAEFSADQGGVVSFDGLGNFEDLGAGETDTVTFTYQAEDADFGSSNLATVTYTVIGENDPVQLVGGGFISSFLSEDNVTDTATINFNDPDANDVITLSLISAASIGDEISTFAALDINSLITITDLGGSFEVDFAINPADVDGLGGGETAIFEFDLELSDGNGGTRAIVYTVNLDGVNDTPVADDLAVSTDEDNAVSGTVTASDVDEADTLTFTVVNPGTNGVAVINGDGTFTYTPSADFAGVDTFTFEADDGQGGLDTGTVTVTVNPINDAPLASGALTAAVFDTTNSLQNTTTGGVGLNSAFTAEMWITPDAVGTLATLYSEDQLGVDTTGAFNLNLLANGGIEFEVNNVDVLQTAAGLITTGVPAHISVTHDSTTPAGSDNTFIFLNGQQVASGEVASPTASTNVLVGRRGLGDNFNGNIGELRLFDTALSAGDVQDGFDNQALVGDANLVHYFAFNEADGDAFDLTGNGLTLTAVGDGVPRERSDAPISVNRLAVLEDDGPATISILVDDVDSAADDVDVVLTAADGIISITNPGALNIAGDGTDQVTLTGPVADINAALELLTYTPDANFNGSTTIQIDIADNGNTGTGGNLTATDTILVEVASVNDAPLGDNLVVSGNEDEVISGTLTGSDPDGDALTFSLTTEGANGTTVINGDGTFTYTPDADFSGIDQVFFTVDDGNGGTDLAFINVTIDPVNDAPVLTQNNAGFFSGSTANFGELANFTDIPTTAITISTFVRVETVNGINVLLTYGDASNVDTLFLRINADSAVAFAFNGAGVVSGPTNVTDGAFHHIAGTIDTVTGDMELFLDGVSVGTDTGTPGFPIPTDGILILGHDQDSPGGGFDSNQALTGDLADFVILDGVADAATIADLGNSIVDLTDPNVVLAGQYDEDAGGFVDASGNGNDIITNGVVPQVAGPGVQPIEVLEDGSVFVQLGLDDVDVAGGTVEVEISSTDGIFNFADLTGATITSGANNFGRIRFEAPIATAQTILASFEYEPNNDFNGADNIVVIVDDLGGTGAGGAQSTTLTIPVSVAAVNDAPVGDNQFVNVNEDDVFVGQITAFDAEGDALTFSLDADDANGTTVINSDGSFTHTPDADFNGTNLVTFLVDDGNGGTDTGILNFTVDPVNDAPVAEDDTFAVAEDVALSGSVFDDNGSGPDVDVDGDNFTVTLVDGSGGVGVTITLPSGAELLLNSDGTFDYDQLGAFDALADGETATDSFTYTISDGTLTSQATAVITITGVNDAPIANDDAFTLSEDDGPQTDNVLVNDVDPDTNDVLIVQEGGGTVNVTDTFTITSAGGRNADFNADAAGDITIDLQGNFEDLADGETDTITLTYVAEDPFGESDLATITYTVTGENDAPVSPPLNLGVANEDDNPAPIDLLSNASDVDGEAVTLDVSSIRAVNDAGDALTFNLVGSVLTLDSGQFEGLGVGETDTISIAYDVTDGNIVSDSVFGPPTIPNSGFFFIIDFDTGLASSVARVIGGNPNVAADLGVINGMVINLNPNNDEWTASAFTYENGVETIQSPDGFEIAGYAGAQSTIGDVIQFDDTTTSATLTFRGENIPTPNGNQLVTATVNDVNFIDGSGEVFIQDIDFDIESTASTTALGIVQGANDAPVAAADVATTDEDTPVNIDVLANDFDADVNDVLTVTAVTTPNNGSVVIEANGTLTYTPDIGFDGVDSFNYTVEDGNGGVDSIAVSITVNAVNSAPVVNNALSQATGEIGVAPAANISLAALDGTDGFAITGNDTFDYVGGILDSAGDINGDGFDDIIMGSYRSDTAAALAGETYVVFGSAAPAAAILDVAALNGANGFALSSGAVADRSGKDVAFIGDFNNDGFEDLAIGATDAGAGDAGEIYVVFGTDAGFAASIDLSALDGTDGFIASGGAGGEVGVEVAAGGDINGDGIDDLLVANGNTSAVVFGTDIAFGASLDLGALDGTDGFVITGAGGSIGSGLNSIGDVNGDGIDDLVVTNISAERVFVVFGDDTGFAATVSTAALNGSNGFEITDASGQFGLFVDGAGDFNGDGFNDILVGAPDGPSGDGDVFVVFGTDAGFGATVTAASGLRINGADGGDGLGRGISNAGDINGDGIDDIIVSAPYDDNAGGEAAGRSFVIFGGAGFGNGQVFDIATIDGTNGFVIDGDQEGIGFADGAGASVSAGGDINGDGRADLVVGAFGSDAGGTQDSGTTYVIFGPSFDAVLSVTGNIIIDDADSAAGTVSFVEDGAGFLGTFSVIDADVDADGDQDIVWDFLIDQATEFDPLTQGEVITQTYTLTYDDGDGATVDEVVTVTITGVNDGPVAADDTAVTDEDTAVVIDVLLNDLDVDAGDVLTVTAVSTPGNGSVVDNGDGTITYTPDADFFGSDTFTYDVSDSTGATDTATVTVTVNSVIDPINAVAMSAVQAGGNGSGFIINGITSGDQSGVSVSDAGDVNGDGFDDIVVGAYFADGAAGQSYVVFGKADGAVINLSDIDQASGVGGFAIDGGGTDPRSGFSVDGAADINGDGLDDLIISSYQEGPNGLGSGQAFVVFGKSGDTGRVDLGALAAGEGFAINGAAADDFAGFSVSTISDVNGDGLDDLIVSSAFADVGGSPDAGKVHVVFGKADDTDIELSAIVPAAGLGFEIIGEQTNEQLGNKVSNAGDFNNDGIEDLIISAPNFDGGVGAEGRAFIVFGKADDAQVDVANIAAGLGGGIALEAGTVGDYLGTSVSDAGDFNGDGIDDIIVGASGVNTNGADAGAAYIIFGRVGGALTPIDIATLGAADGIIINGADAGDNIGKSVSSAGDVNGDGFEDVIIGGDGIDTAGGNTGGAFVIFGTSSTATIELSGIEAGGAGGFLIEGVDSGDFTGGNDVSGGGDINGDGFDDLIVTAKNAGPGGNATAGETTVIFGGELIGANDANIVGDAAANILIGSDDFDDRIIGGAGDDTIDGGGGDDYLSGGGGADVFVFNDGDGNDVIRGFGDISGGIGVDEIDFDAATFGFIDFGDVQAAMTTVGLNTLLTLDADDSILFLDRDIDSFVAGEFDFGGA